MPPIVLTCSRDPEAARPSIFALRQAGWTGAIAVVRPGEPTAPLRACALLFAGGVDIDPQHWDRHGRAPWPGPIDPERDAIELHWARTGWRRNLPMLGLCRGAQLLAVSRGGSLHVDIATASGCAPEAHQHGNAHDGAVRHDVHVHAGATLTRLLARAHVTVNSRHHQAVREPGDGLRAAAHDHDTAMPDGPLVEAIEAADPRRWVFGVQWHPENLVRRHDGAGVAARRLFRAFVQAAWRASVRDARRAPQPDASAIAAR